MSCQILTCYDPITQNDLKELIALLKEEKCLYLCNPQNNISILKIVLYGLPIHILNRPLNMKTITLANEQERVLQGDFTCLEEGVRQYIFKHCLYYETIVQKRVSEKRMRHILSVAQLCQVIAKAHGYDAHKAYLAGLLHDIDKEQDTHKVMQKHFCHLLKTPQAIHHSYTATIFLKEKLCIDDEEILDAIYHHSDGESSQPLAKILFVADKLDPLRGYPVDKQIELCLRDLDAGFKLVKQEQEVYLNKKGIA